MPSAFDAIAYFWRLNPALYYALWALLGIYGAWILDLSCGLVVLLFLMIPFLFSSSPRQHLALFFLGPCCALTFFFYASHLYYFPLLPEEGIKGTAHFIPSTIRLVPSHMGLVWRIEGALKHFVVLSTKKPLEVKGARMQLQLKAANLSSKLPLDNKSYLIQGTLRGKEGVYFLKTEKGKRFVPVQTSSSLFSLRYFSKKWVKQSIEKRFSDEQVAALLTGLVTGEVTNQQISSTLMRFGLLHIMAVSGLHFSLLTAFFTPLFALLFRSVQLPFLFLFLGGYAAFLGPNPSVLRALSAVFFTMLASFIAKEARSCNTLGLGLLVLLVWDPFFALQLSFQLSFLATAAILILYPAWGLILEAVFRKFDLKEILKTRKIEQIAMIILAFLRSALGLTCAVHMIMIPVSLALFGFFPYLSLFYNLFFPSLIGVSLLLFFAGFTLDAISPLGSVVHGFNHVYTRLVLNTAIQMPPYWDQAALRAQPSKLTVLLLVSVLFYAFIWIGAVLEEKNEKEEDLK